MASPDPEGMSLLAKVLAAGAAVVTPIWGAHKYVEAKLDKKADKETVSQEFKEVRDELAIQRGNQGKIFDQMREDRAAAEQRHREVLMHLLEKR